MKKSPVQRSVVIISFRFDPGLLSDVAHHGVLSFYPLHQFFRILIGDRESRFIQLGYALRVLDRFRKRGDQFPGDIAGQVGWAENSKPRIKIHFGKTKLGKGSKASHLTYLGDATIGEKTNIGAGTITCNYDGKNKHETHIGDNVKIGSDTMLVAPVTIGDGAVTGAGSVVTKDVEANKLVVGAPARAIKTVTGDK